MTDNLLSVHDAQAHILSFFKQVGTETIDLETCAGRVLAEDVATQLDLPAFANSSMDGFAVRSEDIQHASPEHPAWLEVVGDIPAGEAPALRLNSGQAARVMTGAPLPDGADCVVPVEETDQERQQQHAPVPPQVAIYSSLRAGQYVRTKGSDLHRGDSILPRGQVIQPQDVGMLAAVGMESVTVYRRPCVALFSSGNELVKPGQPLQPGQVYNSNTFMLSALLQGEGAQVHQLGTAPDDPQQVYDLLRKSLEHQVDLIVTSAGVSVGAFDYVRQVIEAHGRLTFWRVNMRPGKPLAFGFFEGIPLIGLPGNPVSAYVGCRVFVLPVIHKLSGKEPLQRPKTRAVLSDRIESDGRESYLRARVHDENGKMVAELTGHQGSGNLFSLVQANALLIVPSGVKSLPSGAEVDVWLM